MSVYIRERCRTSQEPGSWEMRSVWTDSQTIQSFKNSEKLKKAKELLISTSDTLSKLSHIYISHSSWALLYLSSFGMLSILNIATRIQTWVTYSKGSSCANLPRNTKSFVRAFFLCYVLLKSRMTIRVFSCQVVSSDV